MASLNLNIAFNMRECFRFTNLCHSAHELSLKYFLLLYKEFHIKLFESLIILFCLKQTLLKDEKSDTLLYDYITNRRTERVCAASMLLYTHI
jgi:hypothetical protein